jgi:glycosyltransferase involved in cell wall biosynthesis
MKTSLIILTRNEIAGLKKMLRKIPFEAVDEYFAVDYKSTDGTIEFFEKNHIPIIHQKIPGRAEAFNLAASSAKGDFLIFFSPDGNENPADIPLLTEELKNGADLVIASRFLPGSRNEEDDHLFKFRKWANMGFTLAANLAFRRRGPYITDTINGYRGINKKFFKSLKLDASGFAIEYQMTMRALKRRATITEIPTIEGNRIGGKSGSSALPTGVKFIYYGIREILP